MESARSNQPVIMNRTMRRADLAGPEGRAFVRELNRLLRRMHRRGVAPSSWFGSLPGKGRRLRRPGAGRPPRPIGPEQRLDYRPLAGAVDDARLPWFLYWEIFWTCKHARDFLGPGARVLEAGGASSLSACWLASRGVEVHAVEINPGLVANGRRIARRMGWPLHSHLMDLGRLGFAGEVFDQAYSICVFEHLDYDLKQRALGELARCLKPGGLLSLTFDYRNPAPGVHGLGKDPSARNRLSSPADLERAFLSTGLFELRGNRDFLDNGRDYLIHRRFGDAPYTFGALFLRKPASPGGAA